MSKLNGSIDMNKLIMNDDRLEKRLSSIIDKIEQLEQAADKLDKQEIDMKISTVTDEEQTKKSVRKTKNVAQKEADKNPIKLKTYTEDLDPKRLVSKKDTKRGGIRLKKYDDEFHLDTAYDRASVADVNSKQKDNVAYFKKFIDKYIAAQKLGKSNLISSDMTELFNKITTVASDDNEKTKSLKQGYLEYAKSMEIEINTLIDLVNQQMEAERQLNAERRKNSSVVPQKESVSDTKDLKKELAEVRDILKETRDEATKTEEALSQSGSKSSVLLDDDNSDLEDKLSTIKEIAQAYNNVISIEDKMNETNEGTKKYENLEADLESAEGAVRDFESSYSRVLVQLTDGSKVDIPLDEEFSETVANIISDASKIADITLVSPELQKALDGYEALGNIIDRNIAKSGNKAGTIKVGDVRETTAAYNQLSACTQEISRLENAIANIKAQDPDGIFGDLSQLEQAEKLLSVLRRRVEEIPRETAFSDLTEGLFEDADWDKFQPEFDKMFEAVRTGAISAEDAVESLIKTANQLASSDGVKTEVLSGDTGKQQQEQRDLQTELNATKEKLRGLISSWVELNEQRESLQFTDNMSFAQEIDKISLETDDLVGGLKEAVDFYKQLNKSYKSGESMQYQGALGSMWAVADIEDIQHQRKVIAAYMQRMNDEGISYDGILGKTVEKEVTGTFNKYIKGLQEWEQESQRVSAVNAEVEASLSKVKDTVFELLSAFGKIDVLGLSNFSGITNRFSMQLNGDDIDSLVEKLLKYSGILKQIQEVNQTPLSSPASGTSKAAEEAKEEAEIIENVGKQIDEANEKAEQSEEEFEHAIVESRQKSANAAKKEASEIVKANSEIIKSNQDLVKYNKSSHKIIGTTDSDTLRSITYQDEIGRTFTEGEKYNKKTGWTYFYKELTSYTQLEQEAIKYTKELALAHADLEKEQRKNKPDADTLVAINNQIAILESRLRDVIEQARIYDQEGGLGQEYNLNLFTDRVKRSYDEYSAGIKVKTAKEIRKENEKNLKIVQQEQKEINKTNGYLDTALNTLKKTSAKYGNNVNKPLDAASTSLLEQERQRIEGIINGYRNNKSLTPVDSAAIKSLLTDFEMFGKKLQDKVYAQIQLNAKNVDENLEKVRTKLKILISDMKESGDTSTKIYADAQKLLNKLNQPNIDAKDVANIASQTNILSQKLKATNDQYNKNYNIVQNYSDAQRKLNDLLIQQVKNGKSNELTAKIEAQKKEVANLKQEATEATLAIVHMFNAGGISKTQKSKAVDLMRDINTGSDKSSAVLAGSIEDQKNKAEYEENIEVIKKYITAKKELNKLNGQLVKTGDSTGLTNQIKEQTEIVEKLEKKANAAKISIWQMLQAGKISPEDDEKARKLKDSANNTLTDSLSNALNTEMVKHQGEIDSIREKYEKLGVETSEIDKKLQALVNAYTEVANASTKSADVRIQKELEYKKVLESTEQALLADTKISKDKSALKQAVTNEQKAVEKMKKIIDRINLNKKDFKYDDQYDAELESVTAEIKTLSTLAENLNFVDEKDIQDFVQLRQAAEEALDRIQTKTNNLQYKTPDVEDVKKKMVEIQKIMDQNTRMPKGMKQTFQALQEKYQLLIDTKGSVSQFKALNAELQDMVLNLQKSGKTGKSFFSQMGQRLTDMNAKFIATYFSFQDIIRYTRQAYQYVAEIDKQMIELEKVSNMSSSRLEQSFEHATVAAKDLGSTVSDVISATADWARVGYDADAAEKLAEVAILYKNVGDGIDISTANESLISTLQGFQLDVSEAESIIDKFNEVANNYAIDSAGIGEALKRSAASFNVANTDLSESIALITATNTVIQDPTSVGTMWKTVSARIRGAKAELEDMGEDTDGMVESTSKLRDLVKGMTGFDIMEDENTFKSIYEIIVGIGKEWDNLNDIDRAGLLEALAGKRAGNSLAAALQNYELIEEAYATAEGSAGSAMREQEKWEQGLEAKTNKLKASIEELSTTLLDSDFLGGLVDTGRIVIDVLTGIIDKLGVIPSLLGAVGAGFGIKSVIKGDGKCGLKIVHIS